MIYTYLETRKLALSSLNCLLRLSIDGAFVFANQAASSRVSRQKTEKYGTTARNEVTRQPFKNQMFLKHQVTASVMPRVGQ